MDGNPWTFKVPDNFMQTPEGALQSLISKTVYCSKCLHKEVCKKIDEEVSDCKDFMNSCDHTIYGNVYDMFQPIFDWLKFHYPAGEVKFVVDNNTAKMFLEHGPLAISKELKEGMGLINRGHMLEGKEKYPGMQEKTV